LGKSFRPKNARLLARSKSQRRRWMPTGEIAEGAPRHFPRSRAPRSWNWRADT
jgi:hypothetical protein